ncbi:MAG: alpha/beta hydrolase [Actinomycetota bacterium]|nr:alpha/beta hydrolase [Actinomycetota bacterium]
MSDGSIEITERTVSTNGVDLRVLDAGEGPPVILAHGFPELAYSWRHQIPRLAAAGYRVLAPDQRGYGGSTRPEAIADYDIEHLTGDLLGILDDIGEEKAIFVGHDWGSMVVWQLSLLAPERVAGVVGMSVPFLPRSPLPPTQLMRQVMGDNFFYILYFQEPGVADENLGRDPATTMRRLLAGLTDPGEEAAINASAGDGRGFVERIPEPDGLPDWLSQDELDVYVETFTETGFTGGINWYRNFDRNWERTSHIAGRHVTAPSLFIGGSADPVLTMSPTSAMDGWLDDHRGTVLVEGAGHWVQQERPDEVNDALVAFVDDVYSANAATTA